MPNVTAAQTLVEGDGITPSPALTNILLSSFPTATGFNGIAGTLAGSVQDKNDGDSFIVKVDQQITKNESLTGRYALARSQQVFPLGGLGFGAGSRLPQSAQSSPTRVQISVQPTLDLERNKINEVRFGCSRYRTSFHRSMRALIRPAFGTARLPFNMGTGKTGLPEVDFGGTFENLGGAHSAFRAGAPQSFRILDNPRWLRGRPR